jgi:two-component system response regulator GlrR
MNASKKPKLVLIDDEPGVLRALSLLLTAMQYSVTSFNSPIAGLAYIKSSSDIDIVVSDLRMPEISGEAVLKAVKEDNQTMPVIIMSGHATTIDMQSLKAAGLDAFKSKPLTPAQFTQAVDTAVGNYQKLDVT